MSRIQRSLTLLAALCLPALPVNAQSTVPKKIVFTGAPQYANADLLAASGLHPGTPLSSADINAGAQALINTGFFSNLSFSFDNITLTYKLLPAPASNFLTARYDNLVWWTAEEIAAELHRRHPLFTTQVPQSGTLQDALVADITAMLAEKGVTAAVSAIPSASGANSMPLDNVRFIMTAPPVRVHAVQIEALSPELAANIDAVRRSFLNQDYSDIDTPPALHSSIEEAMQNEGYLDATLSNYQRSAPTVTAQEIDIDLSISANSGERYRIAAVNWPGSPLLTTSDFAKISTLKVGSPPSLIAWRMTQHALENAYSTRGYMAAKTNIDLQLDHAAHLVTYNVTVIPGQQYAFRNFTLTGVTDNQRQEFLSAWKMQSGMVYDASYVHTFLKQNSAALRSLNGYSLVYKQIIDDTLRKVDLTVEIRKDASLQ
jgi:outer membrane protein assembly factor BamA